MAVSVADVMSECRNHFQKDRLYGSYEISSGVITPTTGITVGAYIAITGSLLNDGVYLVGDGYTLTGTSDEAFDGIVWYLYPPKEFITLCTAISTWDTAHPVTDVISESFGGYSRTNLVNKSGSVAGWQTAFQPKLNRYRRMFKVVPL